ncbi:MAG TPA: fimbrillin family protein [Bacteroidales bacterium]|nr:fimbrillin family protein [Bacteroidales bacterium]
MRSLFILIGLFTLCQCTSDISEQAIDPIQPTVPVTGLKYPVNFQVLRAPDGAVQTEFSSHTKPDFMGIVAQDANRITAGELQYFHKDGLSARFLCFYPKAEKLLDGYAYFSQDGKTDIIYAPAAYAGTIEKPNPDFGFHFQHKLAELRLTVTTSDVYGSEGAKILTVGAITYGKLKMRLDGPQAGSLQPDHSAGAILLPAGYETGTEVRKVLVYPQEDLLLKVEVEEKGVIFTKEVQVDVPLAGKIYNVEMVYLGPEAGFSATLNDWEDGADFEGSL